jgi:hypothetical protein
MWRARGLQHAESCAGQKQLHHPHFSGPWPFPSAGCCSPAACTLPKKPLYAVLTITSLPLSCLGAVQADFSYLQQPPAAAAPS